MRGIIIAAGRGLRMLPMTSFSPKCLLPIGDTTLLNTVELLRNAMYRLASHGPSG